MYARDNYKSYYRQSWALIIGVNKYQHFASLENGCSDAASVQHLLTEHFSFPTTNISSLFDHEATRSMILRTFSSYESLDPDDRLLVFFAGHGITAAGVRGRIGYLVPVDGRYEDKSTLIRWDELIRNAEIIPAKHIFFIMDACYSGLAIQRGALAGGARFVRDMLCRFSRQVIAAGKADEPVADSGGPTGKNSVFTGHLLEGLQGKAADESGLITASYLMDYIYRKVATDFRSRQTPQFGHIDGDGDFIFLAPNSAHLTPVSTSADLRLRPVTPHPETPSTATGDIAIDATFLSWLFMSCSTGALIWFLLTLRCAYTFTVTTFPLLGSLAPSEALVHALTFGSLVFIAAHIFLHWHQRVAGGAFPAQLTPKLTLPRHSALRAVLFVGLVLAPTLAYSWVTGRVFDQLEIVLSNRPDYPSPPRSGLSLLSLPRTGEPPLTSQEWRWRYWGDKHAKKEPVLTSAIPGIEPAWFLLCTAGFAVSSFVAWRRFPRRREPKGRDLGSEIHQRVESELFRK